MKNKMLSGLSALLAVCTLAGCGAAPAADVQTSAVTEEASPAETTAEAADLPAETEQTIPEMDTSPLTLSLYICDRTEDLSFDNPVAQKITELTGVTLEITHSADGNGADDITLMANSGTLPDLIYAADFTPTLADAGGLVKLDDYIGSFGQNFSALYGGNLKPLKYSDGSIYTFGTGEAQSSDIIVNGSFQIQNAVLKEEGYPEIKTLDQLKSCIQSYMEKYPTINGRTTVGLMLCGGTNSYWHSTIGRAGLAAGLNDADGDFIVDDSTGTASYKWLDDRIREYYKWLNGMYNDGLVANISFTQLHSEYSENIKYGNVLSIADDYSHYAEANAYMVQNGMADRTFFPMPVTINNSTNEAELADYGFDGAYGIGITANCPVPERAFRFMDWLCSDDAQSLINWGINGVNGIAESTVSEDGTVENTSAEETGAGLYLHPFPMCGDSAVSDGGDRLTPALSIQKNGYSDAEKETLDAYGVDYIAALFPSRSTLAKAIHGKVSLYDIRNDTEAGILLQSFETYIRAEINHAITCPPDEFDEKWDSISEWLKANGVDNLNELITDMTKAKIKEYVGG